jgi:hypothetical protein
VEAVVIGSQRTEELDTRRTSTLTKIALVVGCHGGAGTTTIARLLGDNAVEWREPFSLESPPPYPTVFVAHANPYGAARAGEILGSFGGRSSRALALVVIDDGRGSMPRQAVLRYRAMEGLLPIIRLPYFVRWRYVDDPLTVTPPIIVRRAIQRLQDIVLA